MGKEKSPGWDGLIVEFFIELWDDIKTPITPIANKSFAEGKLESNVKKGLIKLMPKSIRCSHLKHLCPISMMSVAYKIIEKVIAQRIAPILYKVIIPHQHEFIKGRSIIDKIPMTMVGIK